MYARLKRIPNSFINNSNILCLVPPTIPKMPRKTGPLCSKETLYAVAIDFDAASEAWKSNKISIGDGQYQYKPAKRKR